ncbi:IS3 family transposase, partial [Arcanobacterium canis]
MGFIELDAGRSPALAGVDQAITNAESTVDLVHHSDHGSQYVSLAYHEQLAAAGITQSTSNDGDCYDNALTENVNDSYKNELIHARSRDNVLEVEIA